MSSKIHPMLEKFLKIGCSDMKAAAAAFAVYMDLAEVKAVWELQYALCQELDLIYLTAKDNETDTEPSIYLPLPASHSISAEWLLKVQNTLPIRSKGVIMALKDADSTLVYYNVTEGLSTPDAPEEVQQKKATEDSRKFMQTELWRKRKQLYESAKSASQHNNDNT